MTSTWTVRVVLCSLALLAPSSHVPDSPLPASSLSVRDAHGAWQTIWTAASSTTSWRGAPLLARIPWRSAEGGLRWGELILAGNGESWRTRLVVAQLDPQRMRLRLDSAFTQDRLPDWTIARVSPTSVLAVNAGQFESTIPWGWVVIDGHRWLPAQHGPLAPALMQDDAGMLWWIPGDSVALVAAGSRRVQWAFQSYPALLERDTVVYPLRADGRGVSVTHRDARAAICLARDGSVIVALTRFDGLGQSFGFIPFGLTAPEMAGVMGELGCRDAMLLDGGISAQLLVRTPSGGSHRWAGIRAVPLALLAERTQAHSLGVLPPAFGEAGASPDGQRSTRVSRR